MTPNNPIERLREAWKGETSLDISEESNPGTDEFAKGFNEGLSKARDMIYARLPKLLSAFPTTPTEGDGAGEDEDWLLDQLERWPVRVDQERTTNIEFLMKAAAERIRTLSPRPPVDVERLVERLIKAACDYEWSKHFGGNWSEVERNLEDVKADVLAALRHPALPEGEE
jgi:hypothetical protein